MRLFTPGHSLYTDSLIMHGLAYSLVEGDEQLVVEGLGESYVLDTSLNLDEAVELIRDSWREIRDDLQSPPLNALLQEKHVSFAEEGVLSEGLAGYLRGLAEPGHAAWEGRGARGELMLTLTLPLMPAAGKYLHTDLTKKRRFEAKEYKACAYCVALAAIGLAHMPILSFARSAVVLVLAFSGRVKGEVLRMFYEYMWESEESEEVVKELDPLVNELPVRELTYSFFALAPSDIVHRMHSEEASWRALAARFEFPRGAVQVRGFLSAELDALLGLESNLSELGRGTEKKYHGELVDTLRALLQACRRKEVAGHAVEALSALFSYAETGSLNDLYRFSRSCYKAFEGKRGFTTLVEGLLRAWTPGR